MRFHNVAGYGPFIEYMANLKVTANESIYVYFTGKKTEDGISWCPDCNVAWPVVEAAMADVQGDFVTVDVGDRAFWKDTKNPFRTDKTVHLSVIPALLRWQQPQRLDGEQLLKPDLLEMFFEEE